MCITCESSLRTLKHIKEILLLSLLFFSPQNINTPVDLKISGEQRRHVSSILYELKTKDTGIKSKKSRHLIQKG